MAQYSAISPDFTAAPVIPISLHSRTPIAISAHAAHRRRCALWNITSSDIDEFVATARAYLDLVQSAGLQIELSEAGDHCERRASFPGT